MGAQQNKAVIYGRVSTDEQSFDSQLDDLRVYASSNGYVVVSTFGEKVSGYNQEVERHQYQAMKDYVLANDIKHIIVWELSRLGRSTIHTLQEIDFFTKNDVNIIIKKENVHTLTDDPASKMLLTMLSSVAEFERNTIVSRSKRGIKSSILAGKRTALPQLPYGFTANDEGFLIIEEKEAKVIKIIYKMFLQGKSIRGIATHLNSIGVPTRSELNGKKRELRTGEKIKVIWRTNTIRKIIQSPYAKGERHYEGDVIKIPPIISEDDWNESQNHFKTKKGYQTSTKYNYLLKGKIVCGHCGLSHIAHTYKKDNITPSSIYKCNGGLDAGIKCKAGQFNSRVLDKNVYALLFTHKELFETLYKESIDGFDLSESEKKIDYYNGLISEGLKKSKRLVTLFKNGYMLEEEFEAEQLISRNEIKNYEAKIIKLREDIEHFNSLDFDDIDLFKKFILENNFDTKRDFVEKYVDKILIYQIKETDLDVTNIISTSFAVNFNDQDKEYIKVSFNKLDGRSKLIYVEVLAFGLETPIKCLMSNIGGIFYPDQDLVYNDYFLTKK